MSESLDTPPTTVELEVREAGVGRVPSPPVGELPAGGAVWAIPHQLTKIALINQMSRSYRWTFDEALRFSKTESLKLLRDTEVCDALDTRLMATVQLSWHLEARDETDPKQADAVKKLTAVIEQTPYLQDLFKSLLLAVWFGRSGVALVYEWDYSHPDGERRMVVRKHRPINGDSLVARWSGDWGQLVNGTFPGEKEATDRGYAHWFTAAETESLIVHTHDPYDADYLEPELAGQIMGSGLRGKVFYYWWLSQQFLALLEDYSERFANGVWEASYPEGNPDGKQAMADSLAGYRANRVLEKPVRPDGSSSYGITIHEVGTATPAFIWEVVQWLRTSIRKYITGNALNGEKEVNIGGDGIAASEDQISRVTKYDAERLADTLSAQWLPVLAKYNCPGVPPPYFVFEIDRPNAGELLSFAQALLNMNSTVDLDHLHAVSGVPMGQPGANVAQKLAPMSPVAVNAQPLGTPMAGTPGPADPTQQPPVTTPAPPQPSPSPPATATPTPAA